jgi:hypothetical protein
VVDYRALGWFAVAGVVACAVIAATERWRVRRSVNRLLARMRRDQELGVEDRPRLQPESQYVVWLSESEMSCTHPDGTTERVAWDDLQRVEIVTTDHGPFLPDVFWVLHGSEAGCVVPQGATGDRELLERLQQLPGFRNEAVIEAMPSTENRRFLCWEKRGGAGETRTGGSE